MTPLLHKHASVGIHYLTYCIYGCTNESYEQWIPILAMNWGAGRIIETAVGNVADRKRHAWQDTAFFSRH